MLRSDLKLLLELYRRGQFDKIRFYDRFVDQFVSLHPKQIEALELWTDDETTYIGYGGAARGGKSFLIAFACVVEALAYPETRYLIGRKNLTILYQTTWKTIERMLDNFGLERKKDYTFNGVRHELTFRNGSMIICKNLELRPSDEEATDFGSLEITKAMIDQSEQVPIKIVEKIGERVGSHMAIKYKLKGKVMEAFNPSKTHVNRRYWIPYRDKKELDTRKFVRALPTDNPSVEATAWWKQKAQDYIDGTMTKEEYAKQILGNFDYDDSPNALCTYDALCDVFNNDFVGGGQTYVTADIAGFGSDFFRLFAWDGLRVIEVQSIPKSDAEDIVSAIKMLCSKHRVPMSRVIFDADGVGDILRGKPLRGATGFKANSTAVRILGGKQNYENLKTQCAYKLAELINEGQIYFDADVNAFDQELILEELGMLQRRDMGTDNKLKIIRKEEMMEPLGRSPDYLDNFIMRAYFELRPPVRQKTTKRFDKRRSFSVRKR